MNILELGTDGVRFGFRPEKATIGKAAGSGLFNTPAKIITREMLGSETIYSMRVADNKAIMIKSTDDSFFMGDEVTLSVNERDLYLFDKQEQRIRRGDSRFASYIAMAGGR